MAYEIMEVELLIEELKDKTVKSLASFKETLSKMRVGRANSHILDEVMVDYYGAETPINQVANISVPEARVLMINVWDNSMMKKVEKAIIDANLGIMPNNDGKVIRMIFPDPTEERRQQLAKEVRLDEEKAKISIRNIRRDVMNELKNLEKKKILTEDVRKNNEADVEKLVNAKIEEIEKLAKEKEKEIMTV